MKTFDSIAQFDAFLDERIADLERGFPVVLAEIGKVIQEDAKGRIGSYHAKVGPFPMWDELADATKADREAQGYSDDEPLLREGDLRDAIERLSTNWKTLVGVRGGTPSKDGRTTLGNIAMWQEFGASRKGIAWIPPRPFMGPALYATMDHTIPIAAAAVMARLTGYSESMFLPRTFSRGPIYAMSVKTFALGQSITGGR